MRVFVLSTGRSGTVTFAAACRYITNFSAGHETNAGVHPAQRLVYPDEHIEVDNRLTWFLDRLAARYPDARYIHLRRDPEATAQSFLRRWSRYPQAPLVIRAWAHGIYLRTTPWEEADRIDLCRDYVANVTATIDAFLAGRPARVVDIESAAAVLAETWAWMGAEGDVERARTELSLRHNATPGDGARARWEAAPGRSGVVS